MTICCSLIFSRIVEISASDSLILWVIGAANCSCMSLRVSGCCVGGGGVAGGLIVSGTWEDALSLDDDVCDLLVSLFSVGGHSCGLDGGFLEALVSLGVVDMDIGVVGGLFCADICI